MLGQDELRKKVASLVYAGVFANDTLDNRGSITVNHGTPYESIRTSCDGIPVIMHCWGRIHLKGMFPLMLTRQ